MPRTCQIGRDAEQTCGHSRIAASVRPAPKPALVRPSIADRPLDLLVDRRRDEADLAPVRVGRNVAYMHLQLMRETEREFPVVEDQGALRTLRVWHCKYWTLEPIASFRKLRGVEIASYPDESFDLLSELKELRYLHVLHLPRVTDLEPLSALSELVTLRLATLPSWDSSGKKSIVRSLAPLAALPALQHLELFGVVPENRSLAPLEHAQSLRQGRFSKFPKREIERFYRETAVVNAFAPTPDF